MDSRSLGYRTAKRAFDIVFSALVVAVGLIPCAILSIVIAADIKGSPIYSQERVGRYGKPFRIYKFRSMFADADNVEKYFTPEQLIEWKRERKVENDPRITGLGRILRKTSIDELPQFINVLAGQMSAVGPWPTADIPLAILARHPHRCSDCLGVPGRARLYSASIHPPACRRAFRQAGRPVVEETTVSVGVVPLCL